MWNHIDESISIIIVFETIKLYNYKISMTTSQLISNFPAGKLLTSLYLVEISSSR